MQSKIGIIVATDPERRPFIERFGAEGAYQEQDTYDVIRWDLSHKYRLYLILGGYGEIAAAAATQHLIDVYHVDKIINYGVVGGLSDDIKAGTVGFTRSIVHYGFDLSAHGEHPVGKYPNQDNLYIAPSQDAFPEVATLGIAEFICASADRFVGGGEPKRQLRTDFCADICEMEAAAVVITCNRTRVPCTFIKAVSDGVDEDIAAFEENVRDASARCVEVIAKLLC